MALHDPMVVPLAYELLACLEEEIDKVDNPPRYRGLRAGQIVDHLLGIGADECCEGLAWVRPALFVPSSGVFPEQDSSALKDGTRGWAITLEMGAIRCSPTPDENSIPSDDTWNAVVEAVMDDAAAMRRAICCFIDASPSRKGYVLPLQWEPIAIEGGCVGGTLQIVVRGPACDCIEAGGS
jgi:hypothetical protein